MIKPLNSPRLSDLETRKGLQSVSDLLPRLIRQYEIQAEMMQRRVHVSRTPIALPILDTTSQNATLHQATFGWEE